MKKLFIKMMIITSILALFGCKNSSDPAKWNDKKIDIWFEKGEWLNGWEIKPDLSINKSEFAISYYKNKERWDKAFSFLRNNDLSALQLKRFDIDGDNLFATVSEYMTKEDEEARFEVHRKYIDIQYVIDGSEIMEVAPLSVRQDVLTPYDETRDIEFLTVSNKKSYKGTPDRFLIFFPSDIHRPGLKDGESRKVKKIVVKVRVD